jgi:1,4-alpha-glucan branching enzyme
LKSSLSAEQINHLISGKIADPFSILGAHPIIVRNEKRIIIRSFIPGAKEVVVTDLHSDKELRMSMVHEKGLFEKCVEDDLEIRPYHLRVDFGDNHVSTFYDCYSFLPVLSDYDLFLYNQGNHYNIYEKLGAHPCKHQNVKGTLFAVWAPSAKRVSVVGEFNQWDGRRHQMRCRGGSGVWELFIPSLGEGILYKYE